MCGWLWGVNPFDQFGVELGKTAAGDVADALATGVDAGLDPTTRALLGAYRALEGG